MNQSLRSTVPHPNLSYGAAAIKASDYVRLGVHVKSRPIGNTFPDFRTFPVR